MFSQKIKTFLNNHNPEYKWKLFIIFLSFMVVINSLFLYIIPGTDKVVIDLIHYIDYFICFNFFIDFIWRLFTSKNKLKFFFTIGWIDLLASIPYLYFLRMCKCFYVFSIIRELRSLQRILSFLFKSRISTTLLFSLLMFITSILVSSILVLHFEHNAPNANIHTITGAMWWSINLASTCGNTELFPVTVYGKMVGGCLMVIGYGLFSMNAGVLSSWFMNNLNELHKEENKEDNNT